jgi:pyruvate/2-oxoglutarate dehydrogenase complex dihydrolipoamide acyltransferase (E2) component
MAYNIKTDCPLYTQPKRKFGDRKDGYLEKAEPIPLITSNLFPGRTANEAYIQLKLDLTNVEKYLEKKNAESDDDYKYKLFQILIMTMVKTIWLRPKLNKFYKRNRIYMRNHVSMAFNVKKEFSDEGEETLVVVKFDRDTTLEDVHNVLKREITRGKTIDTDADSGTNGAMKVLSNMPRFLSTFLFRIFRLMDNHGWVPQSLIADDVYHASVLLSNVGSIGLEGGYHHLGNWGTNSVFVLIGEAMPMPFFNEDGSIEMRKGVHVGLTIDERLGDGYYYSKAIRLIKKLIENPELLELPAQEDVDY